MANIRREIESLSPAERRAELGELLARGLLRRKVDDLRAGRTESPTKPPATCLEVAPTNRLSVPTG